MTVESTLSNKLQDLNTKSHAKIRTQVRATQTASSNTYYRSLLHIAAITRSARNF